MRTLITVFGILFLCTNTVFSQLQSELLLAKEVAWFNADNDTVRTQLILDKINLHLQGDSISHQVLVELKRVDVDLISDSTKRSDLMWNASLINYSFGEIYQSIYYIREYEQLGHSANMEFKLLKYLIYEDYDTTISHQLYRELVEVDSSLRVLECLQDVKTYELKNKKLRIAMSYLIPGSGMISIGKPVKGLLSLSLNTASAFAIIYMIQNNLWVNSIGWGVNLVNKFYTGNIRLITNSIEEKEQEQKKELAISCQLLLEDLFDKYQLKYRVIQ